MWRALFALLLSFILSPSPSQAQMDPNHPLVTTNYGRIRGKTMDIGDGRSVYAFIGIPFAASPTRGNRFREPQPVSRWFSEYDATQNRVSCPQTDPRFISPTNIREDEDCLFLNVFVPAQRGGVPQRYPVVVYLHGGEFKYGGKDFYKPDILLKQNVILVVPNYRLGILGFLGTDDIHIPGNFGIRDQIQALRWVSTEIHAFSGDPNAVTIFGHDAGAISVSMMMLTSDARGLFNRSISASGSVFTPWAFQEDPYYQAWTFSRLFQCSSGSRNILRCLKERGASELVSAATTGNYWFRPVVDLNITHTKALLKDFPRRLYERGEVARVPYLCGLTRNEGSLDYYLKYPELAQSVASSQMRDAIERMIRPFLRRYTNSKVIAASIDYYYIQRVNHSSNSLGPGFGGGFGRQNFVAPNKNEKMIEIMGDFLYNAPTDMALKAHSRLGPVAYLYVFSHQGSKSFGPIQRRAAREITRDSYGVTHFDDTSYIVPTEYLPENLDITSNMVAATFSRCIYAFLNPNMYTSNCIFRPYTDLERAYVGFGSYQQPQLLRDFRPPEDMSFWNELVAEIVEETATPPPYFPYTQYQGFQAATWSLLAFLLLFILIVVILCAMICLKKKEETRSLKLLRARDREFEEREAEEL